jgi:hypothetical protein
MLHSSDFAVKFGQTVDKGYRGTPKAIPYTYGLVSGFNDRWEQVKDPTSLAGDFQDVGPVIPAGGKVSVPVVLDADYNFKLLYIKYVGYTLLSSEGPPFSYFAWHDVPPPDMDLDMPNLLASVHSSVLRQVRVNVSFQHSGQYLYGNTSATFQQQQQTMRLPIPLPVIGVQGNEFPVLAIRTAILLPANGVITYDIYNDNTYDIVVGAYACGMKVRL